MRTDHVATYNAAAEAFRAATEAYLAALDKERARAEKALHFAGLIAAVEVPGAIPADGERGDLRLAMARVDEVMEAAE